jgi:hypothetical protein
MLLVVGFVVFSSGYTVYANFLGGIDGLPPLPESYLAEVVADSGDSPGQKTKINPLMGKLIQAFGPDCEELNRPIKLELHAKRTVLAAHEFNIEQDGRVRLTPLSLALFGADHGDGRGIEINTIRADQAYIRFDRPITHGSEMGNRKIVAAELYKNIRVINNHRTPARDDDLQVDIANGPLYYDEDKHMIWTKDFVQVRDYQSKPKPTEIGGQMMDMELLYDSPAGKPGARKQKGESVTGVKSIVLHSNVTMHLYVDGQSGFPGGNRDRPAAAPQPKTATGPATPPPEKAHVKIHTDGRFRYEVGKDYDIARFDAPEGDTGRRPRDVEAKRTLDSLGTVDQLVCEHLELRLRRRESHATQGDPPPSATSPDKSLDIETAHATGADGMVVLTSDAEKLIAKGSDLFYDSSKLLTILKGQPMMEADKDHNVICARELRILEHKPASPNEKSYQTLTGIGPGTVDLIDRNTVPLKKVMRATWQDTLVSTKDGPHDLLTFTGNATFLDYEHKQTLGADTLKVWLQPKENQPPAAPKSTPAAPPPQVTAAGQPTPATDQKSPRPDHLEAIGNVTANSAEMKIHDTARLLVWFKDVLGDGNLPATVSPLANAKKGETQAMTTSGSPRELPAGPPTQTPQRQTLSTPGAIPAPGKQPTLQLAGPPKPASEPRPIDLSARSVEAWVLRSESRNTLDKVWTEGNVHVKQAPASPEDKGVIIEGDTLQMNYRPEGNLLIVNGDLAKLRMDKIYICGPEVSIDQATNKAWVTGGGGMIMESKTNFQGDQLAKPVPLEVQWSESMLFDGKYAEFHKGVQATQAGGAMLSDRMDVYFDRAISLKEGAKGDQPPARVQNLVCDHNVEVIEETKQGDKLIKYQKLVSPSVNMTALEADDFPPPAPNANGSPPNSGNEVRATGPGKLTMWQVGGADPMERPAEPTAPKPQPKATTKQGSKTTEEPMKLTYVSFEKSMYANSKKNKADFYENVRVLNFPCDNPKMKVDFDEMLEKMPQGGMYLRCDQMEVLSRAVKGGRSHQEMTAVGHVIVQSNNITGRATKVTYNEEKDQLIFDGGEDGRATLNKVETPGARPKVIEGKKIIYIRKTGEYKVDEVGSLSGG